MSNVDQLLCCISVQQHQPQPQQQQLKKASSDNKTIVKSAPDKQQQHQQQQKHRYASMYRQLAFQQRTTAVRSKPTATQHSPKIPKVTWTVDGVQSPTNKSSDKSSDKRSPSSAALTTATEERASPKKNSDSQMKTFSQDYYQSRFSRYKVPRRFFHLFVEGGKAAMQRQVTFLLLAMCLEIRNCCCCCCCCLLWVMLWKLCVDATCFFGRQFP